jgi:putative transposase
LIESLHMKKWFTEEPVIRIPSAAETPRAQIREICRRHNVAEQMHVRWARKFARMDVSDARKLGCKETEVSGRCEYEFE